MAGALFYREGVRAVGVDRIIAEAGVAKATLYRHFPSKEHLVAACLSERHERVLEALKAALEGVSGPRARLGAIFDQLRAKADAPEFRGCAFALAVAEHGESERVSAIARTHKTAVREIFARILSEAGISSPRTAGHLALLYEGALASVAVHRDPSFVETSRDCALDVLEWSLQQKQT
ncbi:TetR/AcrR family transcriptional regulator [Neomegalonema sp.]|uniref:TetR/AcrR family transcriptional regulator n=1 Tax=Neomegalonema sp. TaxID=2039713 RepID=UPI002625F090|nr:TetR/AcrR family transcriptional regulator [Neomegalonema sp.]MDD2867387.1 TetR/AcrR family transcriptional regulator [Neomegalonema sp.]